MLGLVALFVAPAPSSFVVSERHLIHRVLELEQESTGPWVGSAGDFDGDGRADFLVGSGDGTRLYSGRALRILREYRASGPISNAGDVDGDGVTDFLIGSLVLSGASGELLRQLGGWVRGPLGDVNGDGGADFVIGDPELSVLCAGSRRTVICGATGGRVWAADGRDGRVLWSRSGGAGECIGANAVAIGDVDGDGAADVAVPVRAQQCWAPDDTLQVLSGRTGEVIWRRSLRGATFDSVLGIDDVDGDGVGDIVLGETSEGFVRVVSGRTAEQVLSFAGGYSSSRAWGTLVDTLEDVDGDGIDELLVRASEPDGGISWKGAPPTRPGFLTVHSTATGVELARFDGHFSGAEFGRYAAGLGDVNGDAAPDLVVGVPEVRKPNGGSGGAFVLSTVPLR